VSEFLIYVQQHGIGVISLITSIYLGLKQLLAASLLHSCLNQYLATSNDPMEFLKESLLYAVGK
jgi:hypothetical protein